MQLIKKIVLFLIILNIYSCKSQQINDTFKSKLAYSLINYHYQNTDSIKLINKTVSLNEDTMIGLAESYPNEFYESIVYLYDKPLEKSIELDTLFNKYEKEFINKKFSNLTKRVKLKRRKLNNPKILLFNGKWGYGYEQISFPFFIGSKGVIYSFFMKKQSVGGGTLYIYKYKYENWFLLFEIPLYVE